MTIFALKTRIIDCISQLNNTFIEHEHPYVQNLHLFYDKISANYPENWETKNWQDSAILLWENAVKRAITNSTLTIK